MYSLHCVCICILCIVFHVKHHCVSGLRCVYCMFVNVFLCVCVCYRVLVCAVFIGLSAEDRQVSVENNIGQGVDHWLIVDDQKNL